MQHHAPRTPSLFYRPLSFRPPATTTGGCPTPRSCTPWWTTAAPPTPQTPPTTTPPGHRPVFHATETAFWYWSSTTLGEGRGDNAAYVAFGRACGVADYDEATGEQLGDPKTGSTTTPRTEAPRSRARCERLRQTTSSKAWWRPTQPLMTPCSTSERRTAGSRMSGSNLGITCKGLGHCARWASSELSGLVGS